MGSVPDDPFEALVTLRGLQRTLLLSLAARAASQGCAGFADSATAELAARFGSHLPPAGRLTRAAVVGTTLVIDAATEAWARAHPSGLVVTVGAGLCTRFRRLRHLPVEWLDVDGEGSLNVRRAALPGAPPSVVGGLDPATWEHRVRGRPVLVIAEGVAMYLPRAEVDAAIRGYRAAGFAFAIETVGEVPSRVSRVRSRSLGSDGCAFQWAGDVGETVVHSLPHARSLLGPLGPLLWALGAGGWVRVSLDKG